MGLESPNFLAVVINVDWCAMFRASFGEGPVARYLIHLPQITLGKLTATLVFPGNWQKVIGGHGLSFRVLCKDQAKDSRRERKSKRQAGRSHFES